jgi:hypothetical protein
MKKRQLVSWSSCSLARHSQEEFVEIKVGIQHVTREIVVETTESAADVQKAFEEAMNGNGSGVFTLTDEHGRKVLIPAERIAYVDIGEENARRVGFGAV